MLGRGPPRPAGESGGGVRIDGSTWQRARFRGNVAGTEEELAMAILGFDAFAFPGAAAMLWLRQNANFRFTGFYLAPAPRHPDASWMGSRAFLAANGWGTIPTYVGLQVEDGGLSPSTGAQHGQHAAALMQQAGFPFGSVVYLDLEKPDLTPAFTAY